MREHIQVKMIKSAVINLLLLLLLYDCVSFGHRTSSIMSNSCPRYFTHRRDTNEWFGFVHVNTPDSGRRNARELVLPSDCDNSSVSKQNSVI